ncbi:hypothetical protein [Vibrio alginolyticus]|uniref:hypothetical protein n=1 Tax=Vibrio alginolyticus TaxID=663 RepID=UPI0006CA8AED|nr:hypothetical protein [Vibrio alginolyticus]KPM95045.1 hypothetical protein AOG25_26495 [Vibrio alginolyticus]
MGQTVKKSPVVTGNAERRNHFDTSNQKKKSHRDSRHMSDAQLKSAIKNGTEEELVTNQLNKSTKFKKRIIAKGTRGRR